MSVWDNIAGAFGFPPIQNVAVPLTNVTRASGGEVWASFTGNNDVPGNLPLPTESTILTLSAAEACVGVISGAVASLPMHIYRRQADGERDQLMNDQLWWVLNEEFSPRWSAAAGWEFLCRSRMYHGDAFAIIERNRAGEVVGLEPIHPRRVTVYLTTAKRLVYAIEVEGLPGEERRVLDQDDMLHIPSDGFDGFRSPSPLRNQLRMIGASALAMQQYNAQFFANSARPDYVLQHKEGATLSPEQIENLRQQIAENHGGVSNSRKPMILTGLEFKTVSMPIEDVQLLSLRQFAVEEVARVYRVPPFMIGHSEKTTSWGSGVEAMGVGFVRYTLRQHLNHFTNEINRKFFRTASRFAEFDTTELERADTKSLFEAYKVALGGQGAPGWMAPNEVRRKMNLKAVAGGDVVNDGSQGAPVSAGIPNAA